MFKQTADDVQNRMSAQHCLIRLACTCVSLTVLKPPYYLEYYNKLPVAKDTKGLILADPASEVAGTGARDRGNGQAQGWWGYLQSVGAGR